MNKGQGIHPRSTLGRREVLTGAAALGACSLLGAGRALAQQPFMFGLTPVFLDSDLEIMSEITEYFSRKLGQTVTPVKRRTYQEITSMLLSGGVQAAWICGFPYVRFRERLSLLAMPLYKGVPLYESYLIVHKDNPAQDMDELEGGVHAFSDPNSNSGYLVTVHLLAERKRNPRSFFSETIFTYSHRNVIRAVSSGLAQSGSVDGYVWDVMEQSEPELVAGTRVIRKSEPLGFPPIACNIDSRTNISVASMAEALYKMHEDPLGQRILKTLHLDGFVPGDPSNYDAIAEKFNAVKDIL